MKPIFFIVPSTLGAIAATPIKPANFTVSKMIFCIFAFLTFFSKSIAAIIIHKSLTVVSNLCIRQKQINCRKC